MTARSRAAICLIMSVLLLRLAITGQHRKFVRPGLGPWLLLSGIVLGIATVVSYRNSHAEQDHDDHEHATPRVGAALLGVAAVLFIVAPGSLGSYGLRNGNAAATRPASSSYAPLDRAAETPLSIKDFVGRAFEADSATLTDAPVRLTGFIDDSTHSELRLARYQIACCAADAQAAIVRLDGAPRPPGHGIWVQVTGTFAGLHNKMPTVAVSSLTIIDEPTEPYE
jgi:uncharacterized repeat protein (TIGR03943 family)